MNLTAIAREVLAETAILAKGDPNVVRMTILHMKKPWIPGQDAVILAPLRTGLGKFFRQVVARRYGQIWYFPSATWWLAHARASHPPDGSGCNARVHADFLTKDGKNAEFLYGAFMIDGSIRVLEGEDFAVECAWWEKHF